MNEFNDLYKKILKSYIINESNDNTMTLEIPDILLHCKHCGAKIARYDENGKLHSCATEDCPKCKKHLFENMKEQGEYLDALSNYENVQELSKNPSDEKALLKLFNFKKMGYDSNEEKFSLKFFSDKKINNLVFSIIMPNDDNPCYRSRLEYGGQFDNTKPLPIKAADDLLSLITKSKNIIKDLIDVMTTDLNNNTDFMLEESETMQFLLYNLRGKRYNFNSSIFFRNIINDTTKKHEDEINFKNAFNKFFKVLNDLEIKINDEKNGNHIKYKDI